MSKSKKNTVDPDDIIATYGADVARWFMLSDSPPDRDVIWTDERRAGRLALRAAAVAAGGRIRRDRAKPRRRPGRRRSAPRRWRLRKAAHGALAKVSTGIERLHFNVCLAHIREFANALAEVLAPRRQAGARPRLGGSRGRRSFLFNCSRP